MSESAKPDQPQHYFSAQPTVENSERVVEFTIAGRDYQLVTSSGVFSGSRLDPGTAVLLKRISPPDNAGTFLDLGCGYGPISAVLATRADAEVWAVDVNERALDLTRRNTADLPGLVHVRQTEDVPDGIEFDEIWSNPPIKIGKGALHSMLLQWLPRLKTDGCAWLVVSKHLGADSLTTWLESQGFDSEKYASAKGYRILRVTHQI